MTSEPLLIVNCDDFGLTPGVCEAILRSHEKGVATSTSALVNAPAFSAYAEALVSSGMGVGAHLCVVGEDPPILSAQEVPSLVDAQGRFPLSWKTFMIRAATGRIDPADLRAEFAAQLEVMLAAGLTLTHIDSHQNLHLWPEVSTALFECAELHDIGALRLTRSKGWSPTSLGVRTLSALLAKRSHRAGLVSPEASLGLDEAGHLHRGAMIAAIARLGSTSPATAELATHPGLSEDPERARYEWGYEWAEEFAALRHPAVSEAVQRAGFRLGNFADLVAMQLPVNAGDGLGRGAEGERGAISS